MNTYHVVGYDKDPSALAHGLNKETVKKAFTICGYLENLPEVVKLALVLKSQLLLDLDKFLAGTHVFRI